MHLLRVSAVSWSLLTQSEKIQFSVRIVVRFALNGLDIVAVGLMGVLGAITATGLSGQRITIFQYELPSPTASNVVVLVATVALLFIARGGLSIIFARWTAVFLAGIVIKNASKVTRFLFSGSLQRLKRYSRAEIQFLVGQSVNAAFAGVLGSLTTLVIEGTMFLSIFVVFLTVDWSSALVIAAYFALMIFVMQLFTAKRYLQSGRNLQRGAVESGGSILELVDGFREISVLGKQDFFLTRLIDAMKLSARTGVVLQILKSLPRFIAESGLILGALGFVVWQLGRGSLGEGLLALGVFLAGSFRMMTAILPLQQLWNELRVTQKWVTSAQEILLRIKNAPEPLDFNIFSETGRRSPGPNPDNLHTELDLSLDTVSFRFEKNHPRVVDSVNLHVPAGSFAAIVGPSGAGKTTLVDLILGLYDPESGVVQIGGFPPAQLRIEMPGLLAYVPQRPGLVSGSIANNVALGVPNSEINEVAVWNALEQAQLRDLVASLPNNIHSSLGAQSDALSGGQIQRLGLARALYTNPRFIILDEATSALDAATEASVAEAIRKLGSDTTVIVIAHRLSTVQHADQVHVMDEGKLIASGTFKEVRKMVPMIEEYVKLMSFDDGV
ncbi:MAG: ABC transporter ATP-binding protein [Verrucomicrobia bacterium]|nr:ABC transporter ATP-binding protein [Verrucomicrobiota bacterium]